MSDERPSLDFVMLGDPASVHTIRWVEGLRGRGHHVALVPSRETGPNSLRKAIRWLRLRWMARRLARRPGAVLVAQYVPAGIRATVMLGVHPRIGVAWGSDVQRLGPATLRLRIAAIQQRPFLRGCDAVIAPTQDLCRRAIEAGARPERTRALPFGVDTRRFCPGPNPRALRRRLGLLGCRVVLSNRTIAPVYHQATIVEAAAALPSDVAIVMTRHRARPDELGRVMAVARQLGVEGRIRLLDEMPDDDMPDLYRLADVVVSVAASDGGPVTILEAMAVGRPVVATDLPGIREWLGKIDPASLVPIGDPTATATAIRRVLGRGPAEQRRIAQASRAAVEEHAARESALDAMEALHRAVRAPGAGRQRPSTPSG